VGAGSLRNSDVGRRPAQNCPMDQRGGEKKKMEIILGGSKGKWGWNWESSATGRPQVIGESQGDADPKTINDRGLAGINLLKLRKRVTKRRRNFGGEHRRSRFLLKLE